MSDPNWPPKLPAAPHAKSGPETRQFRLTAIERHDLVRALITRIVAVQYDTERCDQERELYRLRQMLDRFSD